MNKHEFVQNIVVRSLPQADKLSACIGYAESMWDQLESLGYGAPKRAAPTSRAPLATARQPVTVEPPANPGGPSAAEAARIAAELRGLRTLHDVQPSDQLHRQIQNLQQQLSELRECG